VFFSKVLNVMDCTFITTFMIALGFRFTGDDNHRIIARLIYCINTIYWYIKLNEFLLINKYVGPLIIIASKMVNLKIIKKKHPKIEMIFCFHLAGGSFQLCNYTFDCSHELRRIQTSY
jgi:hypothetical protein